MTAVDVKVAVPVAPANAKGISAIFFKVLGGA